jgi:hypothetical protein
MTQPDDGPVGLPCLGCGQRLAGDALETDVDQAVGVCPSCGPVCFVTFLDDRGERAQGYLPLDDPRFQALPEPDPYF